MSKYLIYFNDSIKNDYDTYCKVTLCSNLKKLNVISNKLITNIRIYFMLYLHYSSRQNLGKRTNVR